MTIKRKSPRQGLSAGHLLAVRSEIVGATAAMLRSTYVAERRLFEERRTGRPSTYSCGPKWDGGEDAYGNMHESVWDNLANLVLDKGFEPAQFVRAQFMTVVAGSPPLPNKLLSSDAASRYRSISINEPRDLKLALQTQQKLALGQIELQIEAFKRKPRDAWLYVLLDVSLALSALFRYCLADTMTGKRFACVKRAYRSAAVMQYMRLPAVYNDVWQGWIPIDLRDLAPRVRRAQYEAEEEGDDGQD